MRANVERISKEFTWFIWPRFAAISREEPNESLSEELVDALARFGRAFHVEFGVDVFGQSFALFTTDAFTGALFNWRNC